MPEESTVSLFDRELAEYDARNTRAEDGELLGSFGSDGRFTKALEKPVRAKSLLLKIHSTSSYWLCIYDITVTTV